MMNRMASETDFLDDPLMQESFEEEAIDETELSPPMDDGDGGENFKVVIRVRPPLPRETDGPRPFINVVRIPTDHQSIALCEHLETDDGRGTAVFGTQGFTFDHVYDQATLQQEVYDRSAKTAVMSMLHGYNATLIAYGQTGTGKTYTMEGFTSDNARGIIPRATEDIFAYINSSRVQNMRFLVRASYLQIYNEQLSDLLKPQNTQLAIRHTKQRGVYIDGLSEWVVRSPDDVYGLMERGLSLRATGSTKMSALSSRSHAMFMIIVEMMEGDEDAPHTYKFGKLNIVDLAGSEKVRQTGVTGQRLKETQKINWSLHELGNVIAALSRRDKHIPFRNSCLTKALQDSLGGNCKTTLIACISPALESYQESLSTLKFANRAKNIKNEATINEDVDQSTLLRRYEKELHRLREQLQEREEMIATGDSGSLISQLQEGKKQAEDRSREAMQRLAERDSQTKEEKRTLQNRISQLEQVLNNGGIVSDRPVSSDEYTVRLEELDKERQVMEEDKAQVDRYKQLLLKQRDIMLNLTTRLNERDEQILQYQEEIEAYDAYVKMTEDTMNTNLPNIGTRSDAVNHLRRVRVDSEEGTRYRSENGAELYTAEDKIVELLMLRGHSNTPAETFDRSDERRDIEVAIRDRVEATAERTAAEKLMSLRREVDMLQTQLSVSEEKRRSFEYVAEIGKGSQGENTQKLRTYIEREQELIKSSLNLRIINLQNELDSERKNRRQLSRELDKHRFDISQVRHLVDGNKREEIDQLYKRICTVEDRIVDDLAQASPLTSPTLPPTMHADPNANSGEVMAIKRELEVAREQLRLQKRDVDDVQALREQNNAYRSEVERLRLLQQQRQSEGSGEEVQALRKSLNTHVKDRNALRSIMEQRIKPKVDGIFSMIAENRDVNGSLNECRSLQSLVNASITALADSS